MNKRNKTQKIEFRCTLFEKKLLKTKAKKAGLSLSEFCRRSALDVKIIERLSEEQISFYKTLITYHNNFKSISNLFKKRDLNFSKEVKELANEIRTHLKDFKK